MTRTPDTMRFLRFSLLLATAAALPAQHQFLPMGQPAAVVYSSGVYSISLPFAFAMPGGHSLTELHIGEHGRVFPADAGEFDDSSPTTSELVGSPFASINAFWGANGYPDGSGVFANTSLPNVATITWAEVTSGFSGTDRFTYQCQLHADGRIVFVYDSRCPTSLRRLVGLSPGTGVTLPPATDLGALIGAQLLTPSPTIYEAYNESGPAPVAFSMLSAALEFTPVGVGGAFGWIAEGNDGVFDVEIPAASQRSFGGGCYCRSTYTYAPNASGGYDVAVGPGAFDASVGALVGAVADDAITATGIDLGFPMRFPDGSQHQLVDVDPNGRIVPTGAAGLFGDLSPSVADIEGDGYPYFFGLWADWNVLQPAGSDSSGIYFHQAPGVATFTWLDVAQYSGTLAVPPCTWQIRLHASGLVEITHEDLSGLNQIGSGADDVAVGLTTGAPTGALETDHSALGNVPIAVAGSVYEWWHASGAVPLEPCDLRLLDTPELVTMGLPVEGTTWQLQAQRVGAAQFGLYMFSFGQTDLWLEAFGSPCRQSVPAELIELRLADGAGAIDPVDLLLPNVPQLLDVVLHAQCVVDGAVSSRFSGFAGLPFRLAFSNAIAGRLGAF